MVIGNRAFSKCPLKEIHIPNAVEEVPVNGFLSCFGLSRVAFSEPSSLRRIHWHACANGVPLAEISIPDSVEELCSNCFSMCVVFLSESESHRH